MVVVVGVKEVGQFIDPTKKHIYLFTNNKTWVQLQILTLLVKGIMQD